MARYRPPEYCFFCKEPLKAQYLNQDNIPMMQRLIGDTFLGYKDCDCRNPQAKVIKMEERMKEIRERDKKKLIDFIVNNTKSF